MDWRELQEHERFNQIRLMVREEVSTVLEDIWQAAEFFDTDGEFAPVVGQIVNAVQAKIKERGTDGRST